MLHYQLTLLLQLHQLTTLSFWTITLKFGLFLRHSMAAAIRLAALVILLLEANHFVSICQRKGTRLSRISGFHFVKVNFNDLLVFWIATCWKTLVAARFTLWKHHATMNVIFYFFGVIFIRFLVNMLLDHFKLVQFVHLFAQLVSAQSTLAILVLLALRFEFLKWSELILILNLIDVLMVENRLYYSLILTPLVVVHRLSLFMITQIFNSYRISNVHWILHQWLLTVNFLIACTLIEINGFILIFLLLFLLLL